MDLLETSPESAPKSGYTQLYAHLLRTLSIEPEDLEWCARVLQWVVFACRPLTVVELAVAVFVDLESDSIPPDDDIWTRRKMTEDLQSTLGPLLIIADNEVHLVHRTLREFLVESGEVPTKLVLDFARFGDAQFMHGQLAVRCLHYLKLPFEQDKLEAASKRVCPQLRLHTTRSLQNLELLDYAVINWANHVQQGPTGQLFDQVLDFFQNNSAMQRWSELYWAFRVPAKMNDALAPNPTIVPGWDVKSPLKVAAHLGLWEIVSELLKRNLYSPGERRGALAMAVMEGHATTVATIIQSSPRDLEPEVELFTSSLKVACDLGHDSVVKQVLRLWKEDKKDPLELDKLLCDAAGHGHTGIVRLLIEAGANANAAQENTPLGLAVQGG
jgi:hypothetical protein